MPKGHPIHVKRVPWHEDVDRLKRHKHTLQAAVESLAQELERKCCGNSCSRCMRKQNRGD